MMFQAVPDSLNKQTEAAYIAAFLCLVVSCCLRKAQVLGVQLGVPLA